MRSLLFVPGHDERKLVKGLETRADALILDLEDAVPEAAKPRAREIASEFVREYRSRLRLFVRINALSTPHARDDLAAVVAAQPFGLMLPKCECGRDVARLDAQVLAMERAGGLPEGRIRVLPIVTETAASMFELGSYARDAGPRLWGMLWGGEDLAADVGASANRMNGRYTPPFQMARSLCLFGAAAAQVVAVDAVYPDFRDLGGLREEARASAAAGFGAKAAIHPAQVDVINEAFTPSDEAVQQARAVVAAFARDPDAGAVNLDGRMLDRPHLRAAQRLLARVAP